MLFGEKLKTLRLQEKLTQQELVDEINSYSKEVRITRGQVSMWESKPHRQPAYEILNAIAEYFKISVAELTGGNDKSTDTLYDLLRKFRGREIKEIDGSDLPDEDYEYFASAIEKHLRDKKRNPPEI